MGNIFIIGNGFDLDLGWDTRFSDFANSKFWSIGDIKKGLRRHLDRKKNTKAWFDMENELLNYAKATNEQGIGARGISFTLNDDIAFFKELHYSLTEYLKEQQSLPINKDCTAAIVLNSIYKNGYFDNIYSFNYTDLNKIAKQLSITEQITYNHIHGKLSDNSIIIGVDETPLVKGYEEFHKTMSEHYSSHNIFEDLEAAEEVVFFGISFGNIDYSYFDMFFKSQADRTINKLNNRKHITIFTYDEISRKDILLRLTQMGINLQHLYSQCEFQIIRTSVSDDKKQIDKFIKRLSENSIIVQERIINNLASSML